MPRSRGGRASARPMPRATPRPSSPPPRQSHTQAAPPPPAHHHPAPPPATGGGGGMLSGLGGMVAQGMALGTGSALAHRAVDSVLGSRHPEPAQAQEAAAQVAQTPNEPCANFAKTFTDCMSDSNADLEACRYYFDKLQQCKTGGPAPTQQLSAWQ
ncbi:hypothetical protein WJX81_007396 [Elliptochloris bilobata]|uniref:CHCH domain-containing protein n=1 Tax=Elliptochloris bilobata TaxID=381761 RepID=A0AAW1RQX5_9CHLO